ncbi:MAG TPA: MFS transporter [Pirellulales bacterium]|nr:MFS transporter [Pirellulales bacterium]
MSDASTSAARDGYGWIHVLLAAAAMVGTLPGRTHGLGLITEPLLGDLQLDRTLYADINLWATLLGAAFCWPAGILLDWFGVRRVQTIIALLLGAVVLTMPYATRPAALFVLITLTRALGQSMLSVASLTLVGKSFRDRLGLAMGAYSLLIGIGFSVAFKGVGQAVLSFGWRTTWSTIGYVLIAVLAPASWWLVRERRDAPGTTQAEQGGTAGDFTVRQALSSQAFWVFAVASSMYGLVSSGIGLFNQAILQERGFEPETYHTVLAVSSLCGMLANLSGGWAATRLPLGRLLAAAMVLMAASLAALPLVRNVWQVYAYAVTMGSAGGVVTVSFFTVWGAAFGQTHLGKIQGWAQMMTVVASALGPKLFAEWEAQTGSYAGAFYLLAPVFVGLGLAAWVTRLPQPRETVVTPSEEELQLAAL